jgi:hypothetical protein
LGTDRLEETVGILRAMAAVDGNEDWGTTRAGELAYATLAPTGLSPAERALGACAFLAETTGTPSWRMGPLMDAALADVGYRMGRESVPELHDPVRAGRLEAFAARLAEGGIPFNQILASLRDAKDDEAFKQDVFDLFGGRVASYEKRGLRTGEGRQTSSVSRQGLVYHARNGRMLKKALDAIARVWGQTLDEVPFLHLWDGEGAWPSEGVDLNRGWRHDLIRLDSVPVRPLRNLRVASLEVNSNLDLVLDGLHCFELSTHLVSLGAPIHIANVGAKLSLERTQGVRFAPNFGALCSIHSLLADGCELALEGIEAASVVVVNPTALALGPQVRVLGNLEFKIDLDSGSRGAGGGFRNPYAGVREIPSGWTVGGGLNLMAFRGLERIAPDLATPWLQIPARCPYARSGAWRSLPKVTTVEVV